MSNHLCLPICLENPMRSPRVSYDLTALYRNTHSTIPSRIITSKPTDFNGLKEYKSTDDHTGRNGERCIILWKNGTKSTSHYFKSICCHCLWSHSFKVTLENQSENILINCWEPVAQPWVEWHQGDRVLIQHSNSFWHKTELVSTLFSNAKDFSIKVTRCHSAPIVNNT